MDVKGRKKEMENKENIFLCKFLYKFQLIRSIEYFLNISTSLVHKLLHRKLKEIYIRRIHLIFIWYIENTILSKNTLANIGRKFNHFRDMSIFYLSSIIDLLLITYYYIYRKCPTCPLFIPIYPWHFIKSRTISKILRKFSCSV